MIEWLQHFHFLRPGWLLALPLVPVLAYALYRESRAARGWQGVIDRQLLPHLLAGEQSRHRTWFWAPALALAIAILALAGPAWEKQPQPVQQRQDALVILFDQSLSMLARDIQPSRLVRARQKILDVLALREEGTTGLVAYAGDAHVVSPLTDDDRTLANLLPALEPGMMPLPGSRPVQAVREALRLLQDAGHTRGKLLMVTDGIRPTDVDEIADLLDGTAFYLQVLGVGTLAGAPIPTDSGFLKDSDGDIVIPALPRETLQSLASATGGRYADLALDDSDVMPLLEVTPTLEGDDNWLEGRDVIRWHDSGYWLLPLLLPFLLAGFRRGWLFVLLLLPFSPDALALEWRDLWLSADQRGAELLAQEQPEAAAETFRDPDWAAAAHYRAGNYEAALENYRAGDSADHWYNRGNALARSGDYAGAIKAYEQALDREPGMEDAAFNKQLLEQLLQQQDQQQQQNQQQEQQQDQQQDSANSQQGQSGGNSQAQQDPGGDASDGQQQASPGRQQDSPDSADRDGDQGQENAAQAGETRNENQAQQEPQQSPEKRPGDGQDDTGQPPGQNAPGPGTGDAGERERAAANEQWLRRIPDDPAGLLRRKFEYESQRRNQQRRTDDTPAW